MAYADYTAEEIAERGEAIYHERIRPYVEDDHRGDFLVVDIETGEYEIDREDIVASKRILARRPEAVLHGLRIGYPVAYRLGGWFAAAKQ